MSPHIHLSLDLFQEKACIRRIFWHDHKKFWRFQQIPLPHHHSPPLLISCFSIFFLSLSLSPPVPATFLLNIIACAYITFHQNSFHRFCHNIFCLTVYCLFLSFHQIIRLLSQLFFGASDTYLRQFDSFQDASDLARWSFNSTFPQSF